MSSKNRRSFFLQGPLAGGIAVAATTTTTTTTSPCFAEEISVHQSKSSSRTSNNTNLNTNTKIEWEEGNMIVYRREKPYRMFFKIANPDLLYSKTHPPLLTIHGGPSLPSDYLLPLAAVVGTSSKEEEERRRSIVFFDQIGCGLSDSPKDVRDYSIEWTLLDIQKLIDHLQLKQYHLYGHSYGGMLAYEFIRRGKQQQQQQQQQQTMTKSTAVALPKGSSNTTIIERETVDKCQSLILSNTPTSIKETNKELERIEQELLKQNPNPFTINERIRKTCLCRTPQQPQPLTNAYDKAGTVWGGLDVVRDFCCQPLSSLPPLIAPTLTTSVPAEKPSPRKGSSSSSTMPNALILRGEYDFVTQDVMERWAQQQEEDHTGKDSDNNHAHCYYYYFDSTVRTQVFPDCSHHILLENGSDYGTTINAFLVENEV